MSDVQGQERTYPAGVPSWIEVEVPDPQAAAELYGGLLGWSFRDVLPPGAPGSYLVAELDGAPVAAVGSGDARAWATYVAVDDAAASARAVAEAGGRVLHEPETVGPAGTLVRCEDPGGVPFRLWQAGTRLGAQAVNGRGSWHFSNLRTDDPDGALAFYGAVFGWQLDRFGDTGMWRRPGYGAHLAATVDPGIGERLAEAPPGFQDAVAGLEPVDGRPAVWAVVITVEDLDASLVAARDLGAEVVAEDDERWGRTAEIRDPQGATLTLSELPRDEQVDDGRA